MVKKILLLMMLGFSLVIGNYWAGQAQDPPQTPATKAPAGPTTTQTDLSGTYAGTFNCEALGLTGDTTLTINGNEFTTADGKTGRIVASTSSGYTAVAMQVAGTEPAAAPTIVSLRARKNGNRLTLSAVPGVTQVCTFGTSRNVARGRKNQRTPAATGAEVANPAAPVPTESPIPAQTPAPSPTPMPTPEPEPVPSPSASPTPLPSPIPNPTVSPTPVPSPIPSPSPRFGV